VHPQEFGTRSVLHRFECPRRLIDGEATDANAERTSRLVAMKPPMPYFRRDEGSPATH
jgi:hypothetical protein